ncbi:unnamed protein product [Protopolystoma xenopodis]|uniref:Uncharacterized protein n=1 Tax=Protopolystoma xenopodis TaxID=117903 RepID=A0A3S5AC89_9PLAT|nr:unnamed protein product [Protopolystoma xenopodis]
MNGNDAHRISSFTSSCESPFCQHSGLLTSTGTLVGSNLQQSVSPLQVQPCLPADEEKQQPVQPSTRQSVTEISISPAAWSCQVGERIKLIYSASATAASTFAGQDAEKAADVDPEKIVPAFSTDCPDPNALLPRPRDESCPLVTNDPIDCLSDHQLPHYHTHDSLSCSHQPRTYANFNLSHRCHPCHQLPYPDPSPNPSNLVESPDEQQHPHSPGEVPDPQTIKWVLDYLIFQFSDSTQPSLTGNHTGPRPTSLCQCHSQLPTISPTHSKSPPKRANSCGSRLVEFRVSNFGPSNYENAHPNLRHHHHYHHHSRLQALYSLYDQYQHHCLNSPMLPFKQANPAELIGCPCLKPGICYGSVDRGSSSHQTTEHELPVIKIQNQDRCNIMHPTSCDTSVTGHFWCCRTCGFSESCCCRTASCLSPFGGPRCTCPSGCCVAACVPVSSTPSVSLNSLSSLNQSGLSASSKPHASTARLSFLSPPCTKSASDPPLDISSNGLTVAATSLSSLYSTCSRWVS